MNYPLTVSADELDALVRYHSTRLRAEYIPGTDNTAAHQRCERMAELIGLRSAEHVRDLEQQMGLTPVASVIVSAET